MIYWYYTGVICIHLLAQIGRNKYERAKTAESPRDRRLRLVTLCTRLEQVGLFWKPPQLPLVSWFFYTYVSMFDILEGEALREDCSFSLVLFHGPHLSGICFCTVLSHILRIRRNTRNLSNKKVQIPGVRAGNQKSNVSPFDAFWRHGEATDIRTSVSYPRWGGGNLRQ